MERLGESEGFAYVLLELLERAGWAISRRPGLGGFVVIATRGSVNLSAAGDTIGEAASALFQRAAPRRPVAG